LKRQQNFSHTKIILAQRFSQSLNIFVVVEEEHNISLTNDIFQLRKAQHRSKSIKTRRARQVHNCRDPGKQAFIDLIELD